MKRFKYFPLGKELKVQTDIAKKQYQKLVDTYEFDKTIVFFIFFIYNEDKQRNVLINRKIQNHQIPNN